MTVFVQRLSTVCKYFCTYIHLTFINLLNTFSFIILLKLGELYCVCVCLRVCVHAFLGLHVFVDSLAKRYLNCKIYS
jgi:hypothetical protein